MKFLAVVVLALGCASGVDIEPGPRPCTTDADGDGFVDNACGGANDCNDHDPNTHRFAWEFCDGVDNDCDGVTDNDCHYQTQLLHPGKDDVIGEGGYFGCLADRPFRSITFPEAGSGDSAASFGDFFMEETFPIWKQPGPVWYFGRDGHRYLVPYEGVMASWFGPGPGVCSRVRTVTEAVMKSIPVGVMAGGKVCYSPGRRIIKTSTGGKVWDSMFVMQHGCTMGMLGDDTGASGEAVAAELFGPDWHDLVEVIPFATYFNYFAGPRVQAIADYDLDHELELARTIDYNQVSL